MLPVKYRVEQLQLNHMFNVKQGSAPAYLNNQFHNALEIHNTRNSVASFIVPRVNGFGKKSFSYSGVKQWNSLPVQISSAQTKNYFKREVKLHLMAKVLNDESNSFI